MKRRQIGFTMIELMVAIAIISIMLAIFIPLIWPPIQEAKINGAIAQAKEIVTACDLVRITPASSTRNAVNQNVTNAYGSGYADWTEVSILKSKLSNDYLIATDNPFGRPYYFKMTDKSCSVAVELDELIDAWGGYDMEIAGTNSRIIISTPARRLSGPVWVQHQKRFLNGESAR